MSSNVISLWCHEEYFPDDEDLRDAAELLCDQLHTTEEFSKINERTREVYEARTEENW